MLAVFSAKLGVVVHYLPHQLLDHLLPDDTMLLARQFRDGLAITSMTSSASPVSTVSEPAVAGYSAKKSSISSIIMQRRQGAHRYFSFLTSMGPREQR
jgi:hypothetical protein